LPLEILTKYTQNLIYKTCFNSKSVNVMEECLKECHYTAHFSLNGGNKSTMHVIEERLKEIWTIQNTMFLIFKVE
jgi:hypothetical protein